jgi:hypothetical protein
VAETALAGRGRLSARGGTRRGARLNFWRGGVEVEFDWKEGAGISNLTSPFLRASRPFFAFFGLGPFFIPFSAFFTSCSGASHNFGLLGAFLVFIFEFLMKWCHYLVVPLRCFHVKFKRLNAKLNAV